MSAPDPSRPTDCHVDPRFRDLDALGHVNHVVYLTYVEQVRTQYFQEVLGIDVPTDLTWVIATVSCEYLLPLVFGDAVDVGWRLNRLGRASADYEFVLMRDAEVVGRGGGVLVNSDARAARSAPIPDSWRRAATTYEGIEPHAPRQT